MAFKSFKPEFLVQGQWYDNAQRFATYQEAADSALARFRVWTMPSDCRAVESEDPPNYVRKDGQDHSLFSVLGECGKGAKCEECGAFIPDVPGGSLANKYHADSCSLYDQGAK